MLIAKLEILGISVPTRFKGYHDDGFVSSIPKHIQILKNKYPNIKNLEVPEHAGLCMEGKKFRTHIHIFYIDQNSNAKNIRTRAHEETHALDYFGELDILEKKILSEQGVRINFNELREDDEDCLIDMQVRAELGAIYALKSRGIDLDELEGCPDYFNFAREYYEKNVIKKSFSATNVLTV